jgi:hypothetical protein
MGMGLTASFPGVQALSYKVDVGDTWVWQYYSPEKADDKYYLKVVVTGNNGTALTLTGTVYDPVSDNETAFNELAPNFVYSTEQLQILSSNTSLNPLNVSREYANRTVNALRFTMDADNLAYIDWATGVLLEARLNLGSTKINFIIISWTNQDLHSYKKPSTGFTIPGFTLGNTILAGFLGIAAILLKRSMKSQ